MLSLGEVRDYWVNKIGTARAFNKSSAAKASAVKKKQKKRKGYIQKNKVGSDAVQQQRNKQRQLQMLQPDTKTNQRLPE